MALEAVMEYPKPWWITNTIIAITVSAVIFRWSVSYFFVGCPYQPHTLLPAPKSTFKPLMPTTISGSVSLRQDSARPPSFLSFRTSSQLADQRQH